MYSPHASSAINTFIPTQQLKLNFLSAKSCRSGHSSEQTLFGELLLIIIGSFVVALVP